MLLLENQWTIEEKGCNEGRLSKKWNIDHSEGDENETRYKIPKRLKLKQKPSPTPPNKEQLQKLQWLQKKKMNMRAKSNWFRN